MHTDLVSLLNNRFGEELIYRSVADQASPWRGAMIEFYRNPETKTGTVLAVYQHGIACNVTGVTRFEEVVKEPEGDPT